MTGDDYIKRSDALEALKAEYNRKAAEGDFPIGFGLKLAWIEKALNSVPGKSLEDNYGEMLRIMKANGTKSCSPEWLKQWKEGKDENSHG